MGKSGEPLGEKIDGPLDLDILIVRLRSLKENAAEFPGKGEADSAANKLGWIARDGNHRCPDCYAREAEHNQGASPRERRRGAYIEWPN